MWFPSLCLLKHPFINLFQYNLLIFYNQHSQIILSLFPNAPKENVHKKFYLPDLDTFNLHELSNQSIHDQNWFLWPKDNQPETEEKSVHIPKNEFKRRAKVYKNSIECPKTSSQVPRKKRRVMPYTVFNSRTDPVVQFVLYTTSKPSIWSSTAKMDKIQNRWTSMSWYSTT